MSLISRLQLRSHHLFVTPPPPPQELGLHLPSARFDRLFVHLERLASTQRGRAFLNHEFNTVFLVTVTREERIAMGRQGGLTLQAAEVSAVRWATVHEVRRMYEEGDASLVPTR